MASTESLEERAQPARHVELTIIAQDPDVRDKQGRIIRARVRVPLARCEPGPRSPRFHVVDYDATTGELIWAADLSNGKAVLQDHFVDEPDEVLLRDPRFHAQQVYAVAARTLAAFEFALGRRLPWGFQGHQLHIVPHAFAEANAYYSKDDRALLFGYFPTEDGQQVLTCLSHDVVAHETSHAVLDGLRHRFLEPGLPDQAAFHEALADIVALLSVFSTSEVVEELLGKEAPGGRVSAKDVSQERLRAGPLFGVAEQMGHVLIQGRGALRQSATLRPGTEWIDDPVYEEPHLRGEILVAIMSDVLVRMWTERLTELIRHGNLNRTRAAEEGAKAAQHLLTMAIRAIDYLPPVEFEYGDFLAAILASDQEVAPDDEHGYRASLESAFEAFGITHRQRRLVVDLSVDSWVPRYHGLNFAAMRTDVDEVFRFMWENAAPLGINTSFYTHVETVRPSIRVGPDGLVVNEAVADYVQMLDLRGREFVDLAQKWAPPDSAREVTLPDGLDPQTPVRLIGGGTLIFDQFGRAKYHVRKPLEDAERQQRRLQYLIRAGQLDRAGRLGFSTGSSTGQAFAEMHIPATQAGQDW